MRCSLGNPARHSAARIPVDLYAVVRNTVSNRESLQLPGRHSQPAVVVKRRRPSQESRFRSLNLPEGTMSAELQFLKEWIPERMDPGTVFVLENQSSLGHAQNPFIAVMSCP